MPNITEFKSPTGETLPIADTTARVAIGVLEQKTDDLEHAAHDLDNAVKALQKTGGGAANILTFDSVADLPDPSTVPEGTIALVPRRCGTVRIPAAGSADLYGWNLISGQYQLLIGALSWVTEDQPLELKSENAALITEHNLTLYQVDGALAITMDSLPEQESVLYIVVPAMANGVELHGATPIG